MYSYIHEARGFIASRYADARRFDHAMQRNDLARAFHNDLEFVFMNPDTFNPDQFFVYPIQTIIDYLQITHTFYIEKCLDEIALTIDKLSFINDYGLYWSPVLTHTFSLYDQELRRHIKEEEDELFPYLSSLLKAKRSGKMNFNLDHKRKIINHLLDHNDDAEQKLRILIDLLESKSSHFDDQFALNMLLTRLKTFERDLIIHAKIEDEVLLPKALLLEREILNDPGIVC